ncbi:MAG: AgmX/PglI C-terminal domain-containing protein [Myxococcales bacterium]|nr:AgmX/PglI C-terminal domain-containing protein [Myxococcales bacterium]
MVRFGVLVVALAACGRGAAPAQRAAAPAPAPISRAAAAPPAPTADGVLEAVTSRYLPGLRRCYERQMRRDTRVQGTLTLAFTIDERGRVIEASARGRIAPRLGECIERRMLAWRFEAAPAEASFRIPVRLSTL